MAKYFSMEHQSDFDTHFADFILRRGRAGNLSFYDTLSAQARKIRVHLKTSVSTQRKFL